MQLPSSSSSYTLRVRFGRYLGRRLRRAKLTKLASACDAATSQLRDVARAAEDAGDLVQEATADRDAADDDLDAIAKNVRHTLAGRSLDAARNAPYTQIFPDGIGYYTDAPVDAEVPRYTELKARLDGNLPAKDAVRHEAAPKLSQAIEDYRTAETALTDARTAQSLADTRVDAANDAWARSMERIYGALIQDFSRVEAERFFPSARSSRSAVKRKAPASPTAPVG